jgi:glutamine cyclotransferase
MTYWYRKRIAILLAILFICTLWGIISYRSFNHNQSPQILSLSYRLINQYPHNINSYTQGLFFDGDKLYESTGSPIYLPQTQSILGPLDLETGNIDVKVELDRNIYFGEGSTVLKDKIYQLTYKNQKGFVYDAKTFEQIQTFDFESKEGWGLTNDGENLIMSDGTDKITYLDPNNFTSTRQLSVKYQNNPQYNLNELEYVSGHIYANIYQTNQIVKINPENGEILGVLDLSDIVAQTREKQGDIAELNGIAYRASTDTVFITGKLWPQIYETQLQN